jgi:Tfp pilus assembly protein FimT
MEMLLVLVLMVTMGAVAWPTIRRAYESTYLRKAAEQVEAEFTKSRVRAMTSGLPQAFEFEPNTPQYTVQTWQDDSTPLESTPSAAASSNSNAASSATDTVTTIAQRQLPEGVIFTGVQRTFDARATAAESGLSAAGGSSAAPPVMFYPDGTTSEAAVTIANANGRCISISVRGLTGIARMSDIFAKGETPQ